MPMYYENKFILISLENPLKTLKKIKKVFKPCKLIFSCTEHDGNIFWFTTPKPIQIISRDLIWKDKYSTPRFEGSPYIWIHLFWLNLYCYWIPKINEKYYDDYWEQVLWYIYYNKENINKAKKTWPWTDCRTGLSTWKDVYEN